MTRNENYWGEKPTVAQITWKVVPEAATREAMLRAGQIHVCYKPLPSNVAALKADPNVTLEMPLDTRTIFMGLNCQKGVTTDKKVRLAFNYAVDKKAIVKKILFDTAEPMAGPVSPKVFGYFKMEHQYDYNPEKAKPILKERTSLSDKIEKFKKLTDDLEESQILLDLAIDESDEETLAEVTKQISALDKRIAALSFGLMLDGEE